MPNRAPLLPLVVGIATGCVAETHRVECTEIAQVDDSGEHVGVLDCQAIRTNVFGVAQESEDLTAVELIDDHGVFGMTSTSSTSELESEGGPDLDWYDHRVEFSACENYGIGDSDAKRPCWAVYEEDFSPSNGLTVCLGYAAKRHVKSGTAEQHVATPSGLEFCSEVEDWGR